MSTPTTVAPRRPVDAAMALLGSGVPLSLLLDLAYGPHSEELLRHERRRFLPRPPVTDCTTSSSKA